MYQARDYDGDADDYKVGQKMVTVNDKYGVAKTRGLPKVGGKVSVTRGSLCQAADLDLIRDRDDDDVYNMMMMTVFALKSFH